jgi:CheY-like chemotaxis protein
MENLEAPLSTAAGDARPARILVVDDSLTSRSLVVRMLRPDGHALIEASNGREALRRAENSVFDVVITDLFMPDMDGIELIRAMKRRSLGPSIIVLSAADADGPGSLLDAASLFGAVAALQKPAAPPELRRAVREALAARAGAGAGDLMA